MNDDKLRLCRGCRDDFYNREGSGIAMGGCCMSLATAKIVERTKIGWWQNGPYEWKPQLTLNCHRAPGEYAFIAYEDVRIIKRPKPIEEVNDELAQMELLSC